MSTPFGARAGVLIIDDQPLVARGLASLIRDEIGVPVYFGSTRSEIVVSDLAEFRPQLVVIGASQDLMSARERVGIIRGVDTSCRIAVLASSGLDLEPLDLVRLEISSVVSRSAGLDELVVALRQALEGRLAIDSATAGRLLSELARTSSVGGGPDRLEALTRRELQVLELVADGLPNRDVAAALHISENTVKNHMRSIHEKLAVRTRTEAVVKAARNGLLGFR